MNIDAPKTKINIPFLKSKSTTIDTADPTALLKHSRIHLLDRIPVVIRGHLVAFIGEFVGTFMFLFFAFSGTQVANTTTTAQTGASGVTSAANTSNLLYVALAFGFSLTVNAWVFFRITGGLFNPAVTFGMCLIGAVPWFRGAIVVVAQILGAIASAGVVSALFPGDLGVRTELSANTSIVRGLFIEMFLTAELVFTIFMLAAEKHRATFIAPIGIGLALFIAELSGVYFTGGSLNPARSFGPSVVAGKFHGYHWIYWLGPFLGSLVAVAFYKLVKGLEYETVNPEADATHEVEKFEEDDAARPSTSNGKRTGTRTGPHEDVSRTGEVDPTLLKYKPEQRV